jgi:hypothetical protein
VLHGVAKEVLEQLSETAIPVVTDSSPTGRVWTW